MRKTTILDLSLRVTKNCETDHWLLWVDSCLELQEPQHPWQCPLNQSHSDDSAKSKLPTKGILITKLSNITN